ncbi:restriction endonuclease subunit S [Xylella fastidiosa subsp. multiplex]|uniref:restriction endonuclease subunit S n=1 Tax=Xylella fastidiosa TaxID=2371 RepID=UPI0004DCFA68|nr:restriction endonuclease subunit S [Xylella fastidiosa]KFA40884.1 restriction modification system DNA specificity subunit [Xylella fastidiosa]MDD0908956.1 restriction endonuclease subunit S [Xylella fastidiosa subsp. multiplex]MDS9988696.1 restriction endonuclease subunit S [Xylella fastidiosa]UIT47797.1 restriction endonuclease subunit S [Xylella fastidiosa subsp. multiplex]
MSRIDELIAALCPEGVGFKTLGEIFDMKAGKFISSNEISKNQDEHFLYPCYGGNGIRGFVRQNNQEGKYILIGRVGACGNVKRTHGKFFVTDNAVICDSKVEVDIDWAFHLLSVMNLNQYAMKSAQPVLAVRTIEQVKVPLPPLEVQRQIVKVLDTFTTLEAELEARRRQYQYYRDALLTFGEGTDAATRVRWVTLGEIATYANTRIQSVGLDASSYVGVDNLLPDTRGKVRSNFVPTSGTVIGYQANDILIGNIRPYLKKIWLAHSTGGTNQDVLVIRIKDEAKATLKPRYLYYLLASDDFFTYDSQHAKGAKMPRGDKTMIMKYKIPIPPPRSPSPHRCGSRSIRHTGQ